MDETVCVLVSTFNGAKYLDTLLESIVAQTYRPIHVLVRDDGSTDNTVEIISRYCHTDYQGLSFHLTKDDDGNVGSCESFRRLVMSAQGASYYAFCDQDDVWLPQKIERAVRVLERFGQNKPALYAANYQICDHDLTRIGRGRSAEDPKTMSVGRCLFNYGTGLGQGFTLVFNRALRDLAFQEKVVRIHYHDAWLWTVVVGLKLDYVFDDYESALYRRHDETVTATGKGDLELWRARWHYFREGSYFKSISSAAVSYRTLYYDKVISPADRDFLDVFGEPEGYGRDRFKKAFFPYRLKKRLLEELATRFAFLCGKA